MVAVTALIVTLTGAAPASIGVGRSAGKALESYAQTPDAKSTRVLAVVAHPSESVVTYPVTSPAGTRVEPQANGSLNFVQDVPGPPADQSNTFTTSATVATIHTPWALDADGKSLPTTYAYANGSLTQKINTTGAAFPVVADPWATSGLFLYVHFSRVETFKIYNAWKLGTPQETAVICGLLAVVPAAGPILAGACTVVILRAIADINVTVNYAVNNYHKRLVIRLQPVAPYYFGSYAEYSP